MIKSQDHAVSLLQSYLVSEIYFKSYSSTHKTTCRKAPTFALKIKKNIYIHIYIYKWQPNLLHSCYKYYKPKVYTRVGTLIVATIYLQLIQNRHMFQSFTVLHCSHQHCVQPVASDVEVVGCL